MNSKPNGLNLPNLLSGSSATWCPNCNFVRGKDVALIASDLTLQLAKLWSPSSWRYGADHLVETLADEPLQMKLLLSLRPGP